MPIDKFGRHMLASSHLLYSQKPSQLLSSTASSLFECQPVQYCSECVLYIKGYYDLKQHISRYILDNGEIEYILPISGKVQTINITPNTNIFLNDKHFEISSIKSLNIGDKLTFVRGKDLNTNLYVQIVLLCPLVKDE